MATKPKQELTKAAPTDVTKFDYGEDEGRGYEGQTADDIAIPFITVLQPLSPQVVDKMPGAEPGKLFNTVTDEIYDTLSFVPSHTEHVYVEWIPRDSGGGFVAVHALDSEIVRTTLAAATTRFKRHDLENGNHLVETYYMYGSMFDEDGTPCPAVLPFSSTFIKRYKGVNTKLKKFTLLGADGRKKKPPIWAHPLTVATFLDHNAQHKWHNFDIQPTKGDVKTSLMNQDDERYQAAREIATLLKEGKATAAYDTQGKTEGGGEDDSDGVF